MRVTRRDVIAGSVAVVLLSGALALALALALVLASTQTHAQGFKNLEAPVTGALTVKTPQGAPVPGFPLLIRFEDPEYKVVCYYPRESLAISCVKK